MVNSNLVITSKLQPKINLFCTTMYSQIQQTLPRFYHFQKVIHMNFKQLLQMQAMVVRKIQLLLMNLELIILLSMPCLIRNRKEVINSLVGIQIIGLMMKSRIVTCIQMDGSITLIVLNIVKPVLDLLKKSKSIRQIILIQLLRKDFI